MLSQVVGSTFRFQIETKSYRHEVDVIKFAQHHKLRYLVAINVILPTFLACLCITIAPQCTRVQCAIVGRYLDMYCAKEPTTKAVPLSGPHLFRIVE